MASLRDFCNAGKLRCTTIFVDMRGTIWRPGDVLQFSKASGGAFFFNGELVLQLNEDDAEHAKVLTRPELYFELPAMRG